MKSRSPDPGTFQVPLPDFFIVRCCGNSVRLEFSLAAVINLDLINLAMLDCQVLLRVLADKTMITELRYRQAHGKGTKPILATSELLFKTE